MQPPPPGGIHFRALWCLVRTGAANASHARRHKENTGRRAGSHAHAHVPSERGKNHPPNHATSLPRAWRATVARCAFPPAPSAPPRRPCMRWDQRGAQSASTPLHRPPPPSPLLPTRSRFQETISLGQNPSLRDRRVSERSRSEPQFLHPLPFHLPPPVWETAPQLQASQWPRTKGPTPEDSGRLGGRPCRPARVPPGCLSPACTALREGRHVHCPPSSAHPSARPVARDNGGGVAGITRRGASSWTGQSPTAEPCGSPGPARKRGRPRDWPLATCGPAALTTTGKPSVAAAASTSSARGAR